jgi:hypothetical protein
METCVDLFRTFFFFALKTLELSEGETLERWVKELVISFMEFKPPYNTPNPYNLFNVIFIMHIVHTTPTELVYNKSTLSY